MNNAKKYKQEGTNPLASVFNEINSFLAPEKKDEGLVDIMTFCNDPVYLNLPNNNLNLYISQQIILKSFYMGSLGNENLKLTDEEWEWLRSKAKSGEEELDGVLYENNINDVIDKLMKKERGEISTFSQLQLVLGRRSGKCREENDLIATTEGSITFGELLNKLNNKEKIGICTYDQDEWKRSVTFDIKAEDNGIVDCYEIETENGIKEISSHNHPYLILKNDYGQGYCYEPTFVQMQDLNVGDRVAVANCTQLFGKESIGSENAYLLGLNEHEEIPNNILCGSQIEVSAFLTSLLNNNHIYTSKYKKLIFQTKHLLQKFGIHAKVIENETEIYPGKHSRWYTLFIPMHVDLKKISVITKDNSIKFEEIRRVIPVGKRKTIALEVAGTNVIGGDLISHNTLLSSVITAYEAYKLLAINCGDPHGYYGLPNGDEISIINVALSQEQAKILFNAIQARLRDSPFFRNKVASSSSDEIRLYTAKDIEKIKSNDSFLKVNGSIVLMCGHSNPDSLAGRSAILLLFDEIAFFDESGKVTGKYFYGRLKPSLSRFYEKNAGKIVQISSPNTRMGIFYETFEQSKTENSILSFQLPTWHINDKVGYDLPDMTRDRLANPDLFATEYGGQWTTGGVHGYFFEKELIDRSVRHDYAAHKKIDPKYNYFLHVDPAKKSNNYSAVLVAKERYNNHYGKKRIRCILAGAWVWKPVPGIGLNFHQIDKEVLSICRTFRPNLVTYDDYHSLHSLQFLRSHGVNTAQLSYNRNVKMKIYQNLKDLMMYEPNSELILYDDGGWSSLLIQELKHLKFKKTNRGFSLIPDKNSDVPTDDLADALAGACSSANDGVKMSLPQSVTVRSGLF